MGATLAQITALLCSAAILLMGNGLQSTLLPLRAQRVAAAPRRGPALQEDLRKQQVERVEGPDVERALARWSCSTRWAWSRAPSTSPASSPAASASGSQSLGR